MPADIRALLEESFRAAIAAADPLQILAVHLPPPPSGRTFVAAAGKAAASMAVAAETHFPAQLEGIAITRYGHGLPTKRIRVVEAGHPVPDEAGEAAAREILAKVSALPIQGWNFKEEKAVRHVGPMAQDFYAAFGLGLDDKHIATVDADGVALAAIQGLDEKLEEQRAENTHLKQRLEKLEQLMNQANHETN